MQFKYVSNKVFLFFPTQRRILFFSPHLNNDVWETCNSNMWVPCLIYDCIVQENKKNWFICGCLGSQVHAWESWLMCERHDSCVRDMSHVWETWLMYEKTRSRLRDMTRVWENALTCERHDSCVRDMTHMSETWLMCQRHDSCVRDMTHVWETWLTCQRHCTCVRATNHCVVWKMTSLCADTGVRGVSIVSYSVPKSLSGMPYKYSLSMFCIDMGWRRPGCLIS